MNLNSKIFIAGHKGLVGSAILRKLEKAGYEKIITRTREELDLLDNQAVADFLHTEQPDFVFLAAAKVGGIYANNTLPAEFIYSNLTIQNNIIHQSYLSGVKRLLFLGSSCIYPRLCPQPIKEEYLLTGPLEPTNAPYAIAKIAGIEMCYSYNRQYNTQFIPVMPTNLYGPNDNFDLDASHVLPALVRKCHLVKLAAERDIAGIEKDQRIFGPIPEDIKKHLGISGKKISADKKPKLVIWGTGSPRREFLHVDDLAEACVFIMALPQNAFKSISDENSLPAKGVFPLINIGTGEDQTIKVLAEMVKEIVGVSCDLTFDSTKPDGTPEKRLDVSRLNQLNWHYKIKLSEGLKQTYEWYKNKVKG
ncbi:MAG: GDP-L-fucose synthase [Proteobacteria bacterium]|nr:GDP-L-fucose synthase [Pseudomonadota bacterium]